MQLSEKTRRGVRHAYVVTYTLEAILISLFFVPFMNIALPRAIALIWFVLLLCWTPLGLLVLGIMRNRAVEAEVPGYPLFKGQSVNGQPIPSEFDTEKGCRNYLIILMIGPILGCAAGTVIPRQIIDGTRTLGLAIYATIADVIVALATMTHLPKLLVLLSFAALCGFLLAIRAGKAEVRQIERSLGRRLNVPNGEAK